jgi:CheY-like chemotaxis protein
MSKLLLVEDEELNYDMLSRRLKRRGYEVVIATDAHEAYAKAKSELPDLILMDIGLPVTDGWEATQTLKAMPETKNIPVIALTAHAMIEHRERSLQAGCDDFDTKPVDLNRLLEKIQALLQRQATA